MESSRLLELLDNQREAEKWLAEFGIADTKKAFTNIVRIAMLGVPLGKIAVLFKDLHSFLRWSADPDMSLNNLERFFSSCPELEKYVNLFLEDKMAFPTLLQTFSTSQYFSDLIIRDPRFFSYLLESEGKPLVRNELVKEMLEKIDGTENDREVVMAINRFKDRHFLRLAYGDFARGQSIRVVTNQISYVADAACEGALKAAWRKLESKRGVPKNKDGERAKFVVLGLGKLGGRELNYWSDIDLMFLYEGDRGDAENSHSLSAFFVELGREFVRYLTDQSEYGPAYKVDMRLRPHGKHGLLALDVKDAQRYYDMHGRTWERQALIKARPIAGDLEIGDAFLKKLEPWIYRRYLTHADISGIRTLKRKIEHGTHAKGDDYRNVKTGRGGIRDIEFVIQFLQLLNGGELPQVRTGNTIETIAKLEDTGCLSHQEGDILCENYTFLRRVEHRLQILFALQTHTLPLSDDELHKLALRLDYVDYPDRSALDQFRNDYRRRTNLNRKILNHLLHDAFPEQQETLAEVDLMLDPGPDETKIEEVLGKYAFRDVHRAYKLFNELAGENIPYLSTRRCRHFLASIAPELLSTISVTPDPDATLTTLATVSASIGGKGVLWELFSFNKPSLILYVKLCSLAPYLTDMLCRDPGMLDGLMDSLVLDRIPSLEILDKNLQMLCERAIDIEPILHAFKNDMQLSVGVRDILGKNDIRETTGFLSDIAQVCLKQIALYEYGELVKRYGVPHKPGAGPTRWGIIGLGKLGGREMNYHSDLDVLFVYENDGETEIPAGGSGEAIENQFFFNSLAQKIVRKTHQFGTHGKLYSIDTRLRPMGQGGTLAVSLHNLVRFFTEGNADIWQRQTLCKGRVVFASDESHGKEHASILVAHDERENEETMGDMTRNAIIRSIFGKKWQPGWQDEIKKMRSRLREASPEDTLKRGEGGIVDIEFIVQMLQLRFGAEKPGIMAPNTLDGLDRLFAADVLSRDDYEALRDNYRLLRTIEGCLRLMNAPSTNTLPEDPFELTKLGQTARFASGADLKLEVEKAIRDTSERYEKIMDTYS